MSTIQIQTSVEQLLDSVAQLPPDELASLTEKIVALRANQAAPHVAHDEADEERDGNGYPVAAGVADN